MKKGKIKKERYDLIEAIDKQGTKNLDVDLHIVNKISKFFGYGRISLSKRVKDSVKSAVKFVNNYEKTASRIALMNQYDYVVCGHIHQPKIEVVKNRQGDEVLYLNSGDRLKI